MAKGEVFLELFPVVARFAAAFVARPKANEIVYPSGEISVVEAFFVLREGLLVPLNPKVDGGPHACGRRTHCCAKGLWKVQVPEFE